MLGTHRDHVPVANVDVRSDQMILLLREVGWGRGRGGSSSTSNGAYRAGASSN